MLKKVDENRIPKEITEAVCSKHYIKLKKRGKACHCKEIKYYTYVLRKTTRAPNNSMHQSILEPTSAGCACVNPTSDRRRITMPKCICLIFMWV